MVKLNSSTRNSADRSMSIHHILHGKKIVLGITGCIAAYKANLLVREYIRRGAEVKVVMTPSAAEFVTPMTLAALSRNEVIQQIFPRDQKGNVSLGTWHIDLGLWADLMVIAPASVNTVAKLAYGFCDNALTTLAAAMRAKILLCPAADMDMYENPRNRRNLEILEGDGYYVLPAEEGELASGLKVSEGFRKSQKLWKPLNPFFLVQKKTWPENTWSLQPAPLLKILTRCGLLVTAQPEKWGMKSLRLRTFGVQSLPS